MTSLSTATVAIEYADGTIDLIETSDDGEGSIVDTLSPLATRRETLASVGLMESDAPERWIDTDHGKASEFSVEAL